MSLAYLNIHFDEGFGLPHQILERFATMVNWCMAVKQAGVEQVTVVQRAKMGAELEVDGVRYVFVADGLPGKLAPWQVSKALLAQLAALAPDVVHHNGQVFPIRSLRGLLPKKTAMVWQHHGGNRPNGVRRILYRKVFSEFDGFIFTATDQAKEWIGAKLISTAQPIFEVLESSTHFRPIELTEARLQSGMHGNPIFLWVGRLNSNKDPITVLRGFASILHSLPAPRLYMIFSSDDLLGEVKEAISALGLSSHVNLLGFIAHEELPNYFSSADFFVLGSHSEGSGFALIEAIACGATPIVTDIPSFRKILGDGLIGWMWKIGDSQSFAKALVAAGTCPPQRSVIRSHFERHLKFDEIGNDALSAYHRAIEYRNLSIYQRCP